MLAFLAGIAVGIVISTAATPTVYRLVCLHFYNRRN